MNNEKWKMKNSAHNRLSLLEFWRRPKKSHKSAQYQMYCINWLYIVGSLKLKVSFAEYGLFYSALLQKIHTNQLNIKCTVSNGYVWGGFDLKDS